uniref:Uncharacterized protein n=1 Tax=Oncorhynchus mykiss TaxID=8022 RepID=A0A8K9UY67_ONCMY
MPSLSPPEYRIHNLPNNITATDAYPFYIQDDSLPQDSLPPYPPPLHPALTAAYHREEANARTIRNSRNVAVSRGKAASAESYDSAVYESCQNCRRIALTTGCVSAISAFVSTLVLLFLGLIFLQQPHISSRPCLYGSFISKPINIAKYINCFFIGKISKHRHDMPTTNSERTNPCITDQIMIDQH